MHLIGQQVNPRSKTKLQAGHSSFDLHNTNDPHSTKKKQRASFDSRCIQISHVWGFSVPKARLKVKTLEAYNFQT